MRDRLSSEVDHRRWTRVAGLNQGNAHLFAVIACLCLHVRTCRVCAGACKHVRVTVGISHFRTASVYLACRARAFRRAGTQQASRQHRVSTTNFLLVHFDARPCLLLRSKIQGHAIPQARESRRERKRSKDRMLAGGVQRPGICRRACTTCLSPCAIGTATTCPRAMLCLCLCL